MNFTSVNLITGKSGGNKSINGDLYNFTIIFIDNANRKLKNYHIPKRVVLMKINVNIKLQNVSINSKFAHLMQRLRYNKLISKEVFNKTDYCTL